MTGGDEEGCKYGTVWTDKEGYDYHFQSDYQDAWK